MEKELITREPEMNLQSLMMNSGIGDEIDALYVSDMIMRYAAECEESLPNNVLKKIRKKAPKTRMMRKGRSKMPEKEARDLIIPQLVKKHSGKESEMVFAEKSMLSIGFFRERMEWLTEHSGNPSYKVYGDTSKQIYFDYGRKGICEHFYDWTDFLHDVVRVHEDLTRIKPAVAYERVRSHTVFPEGNRAWKAEGMLERVYEIGDLKNRSQNPPGVSDDGTMEINAN